MASEIRVDKITSLSGVGTITPSPTGIDIAGITTVATLKATTGIVTTLTATTGIVTTFEATTGDITTLRAPTGIVTTLTSNTTTLNSTTTATGNINVSGANITLQDSGGASDDRLVFGAGSDLSIYHNGSSSYIQESGTGELIIKSNSLSFTNAAETEHLARFFEDGAVDLYNNSTKRLSTTGNGIDIFGNGTTNNYFKLVNTSGTSNASHHMTLDTYGAGSGGNYWSDLKIDASNIQLNTYTGNRATLSNTALTFASGVNIVMASGNGIDFSATSDSSGTTTSEVLDDYEEGSFTPTSNATISGANGQYTKIGRQITVHIRLIVSSQSNSATFNIESLPFAANMNSGLSNGSQPGGFGYISGSAFTNGEPQIHMRYNDTYVQFYDFGTALSINAWSGREIRLGFIYYAN